MGAQGLRKTYPPDLHTNCDGCGSTLYISSSFSHTLDCRKGSFVVMLQSVRYEWTSGAQFPFNCYCNWDTLVVRDLDGSGYFLHSKEGVIQGVPPCMIDYGIGILLLIREIRNTCPQVMHT